MRPSFILQTDESWQRFFLAAVVCFCICVVPHSNAVAKDPAWTLLKSFEIDLSKATRDVSLIDPAATSELPRSRAVKLVARRGDIVLKRVVITYATGQIHYEDRRIDLSETDHTKPIDEREEARVVSAVSLVIEPQKDATAAILEIWGLVVPDEPELFSTSGLKPGDKFTEVQVLFGTTRRQESDRIKIAADKSERKLASFSGDIANSADGAGDQAVPMLTLGRAVVTVPLERLTGTLPRPEIDLVVTRFEYRREDPAKDFTLAAVDVQSRTEFLASLNSRLGAAVEFKRSVFLFVHGYNVSFDDALYRTAQLAHDMHFDGPALSYSWPSSATTTAYLHDRDAVKSSRQGLFDLLGLVASQPGVASVNIIAHSMGNDPVLEVLSKRRDDLALGAKVSDFKLNEVLFAAPDVSQSVFRLQARDLKSVVKGGGTLYASSNDLALAASKRVSSGTVRAGDVPSTGVLLLPGVDTIDISLASSSMFALNHTTFAERAQLVGDIKELFKSGARPPSKRGSFLELINKSPQPYWRYSVPKRSQ